MKGTTMALLGYFLTVAGFALLVISGLLWYTLPLSLTGIASNSSSGLANGYLTFILNTGMSITSVLLVLLGGMIWSDAQVLTRLDELKWDIAEDEEGEQAH